MAARKRKFQTEKTRAKIKATIIAQRMQKFVLGEMEDDHSFGAWWKVEEPEMPKNMEELKMIVHMAFSAGAKENLVKVEMSTAQVQAGKTLLDRVVPVLRENENLNVEEEKTAQELFSDIKERVGEEIANKMFPEVAAKLQHHHSETVQ